MAFSDSRLLVAPVTPDIGMADHGVIAISVTAVIAGPITISRVTIAVTGIAIGWGISVAIPVSGVAVAIAVTWISVAVTIG